MKRVNFAFGRLNSLMNKQMRQYDVCVIGGGPGGIAAALSAARGGAKVLLVEKNGCMGGNLVIGLPLLGYLDKDGRQVTAGIAQELVDALAARNATYGHRWCPLHNSVTLYDHEQLKIILLEKLLEAKVDMLLHTELTRVNVDDGHIDSVTVFGKGWEIEVSAKIFIDGTGDGDLAYMAGARYEKGQDNCGKMQPPTLMCTVRGVELEKLWKFVEDDPEQMVWGSTVEMKEGYKADFFRASPNHVFVGLRKLFGQLREQGELPVDRDTLIYINSLVPGEVHLNCTRHLGVDGSDIIDLTRAEIEGHLQLPKLVECLRKHVPGFENAYLTQIYPFIGIRESRRFNGISTLKADSIIAGEITEDSIGLGSYIIDIHDGGGAGTIVKKVPPYGLPYGVTVSADIDNLMLTGRCVSVDSVVMSSLRVMPTCMVLGEGAGTAAAMAVKKKILPADVNVKQLRKKLVENGVLMAPVEKKD